MMENKISHKQSEKKQVIDNPLINIAGKFGGEFWHFTQSEIKHCRKIDREETKKLLDLKSDKQD